MSGFHFKKEFLFVTVAAAGLWHGAASASTLSGQPSSTDPFASNWQSPAATATPARTVTPPNTTRTFVFNLSAFSGASLAFLDHGQTLVSTSPLVWRWSDARQNADYDISWKMSSNTVLTLTLGRAGGFSIVADVLDGAPPEPVVAEAAPANAPYTAPPALFPSAFGRTAAPVGGPGVTGAPGLAPPGSAGQPTPSDDPVPDSGPTQPPVVVASNLPAPNPAAPNPPVPVSYDNTQGGVPIEPLGAAFAPPPAPPVIPLPGSALGLLGAMGALLLLGVAQRRRPSA